LDLKMLAALVLPLTLAALMFGMGLALTPAAFIALRHEPLRILGDLASLCLGLPLVALAVGALCRAPPEIRLALLLIGSCPAGAISTVLAAQARADLALSVLLLAMTSLLSVLVTPAALHGLGPWAGAHTGSVALPWGETIGRVALVVAVPVGLGMGVRHAAGPRALLWHARIKTIGGVFVLLIFSSFIVSQRTSLSAALRTALLPVLAYNLAAAAVGLGVAALTRASAERRAALLMAHQVRQEETGIFLAIAAFGMPALVLPLLLNAAVGFTGALVTIALLQRRVASDSGASRALRQQ